MPGKRQPTALLEANGAKHLTQAEADARRDREVHVPIPDKAEPPAWLLKKYHAEFRRIGEILLAAGLYTELDRDTLGQYFVCFDQWLRANRRAASAIRAGDEKLAREWSGVQASYFRQARQCAEVMGLSVTSRCRIVVPDAMVNAAGGSGDSGDEDEFSRRLAQKQNSALASALK